jgi:hypothetical protein
MVAAGALAAMLGGVVRPASAAEQYVNDFGIGVGTVFTNVLYMPVKVVYATLGAITGGFAFVLTGGRMETASAIWVPAMGGTYVISPNMLRGEDPIYFSGTTDDDHGRDRRVEEREPVRDRGTPREGY